jgi:hypothetical protein
MYALNPLRPEIVKLVQLGSLPSEKERPPERILQFEQLIRAITRPVSNNEARALVNLFGDDGCFGLASSLMHLIETAPDWPLKDCLTNTQNVWITELRNRAIRGGFTVV